MWYINHMTDESNGASFDNSLGTPSSSEDSGEVDIEKGREEYKSFLENCSPEERKFLLEEFDGREGQRLALAFMGLKPVMSINAFGPIYHRLAEANPKFRVVNGFFVNKNATLQVLDQNSQYFPDFDKVSASSQVMEVRGFKLPAPAGDMYFDGYISNIKSWSTKSSGPENTIKAGLLYGFPREVVMGAATDPAGQTAKFSNLGVDFTYNPKDEEIVAQYDHKLSAALAPLSPQV